MPDVGLCKRWRWVDAGRSWPADAVRLARELAVPPLVGLLLYRRGCAEAEQARAFLDPKLTRLHEPALLPGVARAAERIVQAVRAKQPIVIYGDYDVDGVTASAVLWHVLTRLGATVHTYIPHRIDEGYGLNCEALAKLASGDFNGQGQDGGHGPRAEGQGTQEEGQPQTDSGVPGAPARPLIISVDCGITALEPAKVAKDAGVDLIITDHHEFDPAHLPDAYALVHPRLPGSEYPFDGLCGAGVAFKLAWQVAKVHCNSERVPADLRALLLELVSLVALGTVADVVPLVDENRVLTTFGLRRIKHTTLAGLNALIDASGLREESIDAYHVGFVLGPRLNACGRMGHAAQALRLLTAAADGEALETARFLSKENDRRRTTERAILDEAKQMVLAAGYDQPGCRAIVLGREGWHAGVVGIVASRLVEAFARPVVLLTYDGGEAHGSARSVEGVSIHEAFCACATHLTSFGGHAMAAGLRLETGNVEAFRSAIVEYVNARLEPADLTSVLTIDAECALADLSLSLCEQIGKLAPFGRGNPAPVLAARDVLLSQPPRRMGAAGNHLRLMLRQGARYAEAVWFNAGDHADALPAGTRLDVAFEPKVDTWQGQRKLALHVKDVCVRVPNVERGA